MMFLSLWTLNLHAQSPPQEPEAKSSTPKESGVVDQPAASTEIKTEPAKTEKKKSAHRGALVPAPLPISSPTVGIGIVLGLGYIFPFNVNDKISPPSTIGAAGLFTNNGSRGLGVGADLYMKKNTYEITGMYARGDVDYNLYGSGVAAGLKLPLTQSGHLIRGEVLRRLWWKIFVGPRFWTGQSFVTVAPTNSQIPPLPSDLGIHTTLRALGVRLIRDTRPNQFYPTAGEKLEFTSDFFMQSLGSKFYFQAYRLTFNKYMGLTKNQVLAMDSFACATAGQPPFYGNCVYGTKNELRGYTPGKYLDRYMATMQAEYRLTLPKGFGLAAFAGVGEVIPGSSQVLFKNDHFLPDVGGGPRFELSKKYHVNLRTDFARGRGSWTWSMGVGESF
jgi:outer membrane protein assembly factor BamA